MLLAQGLQNEGDDTRVPEMLHTRFVRARSRGIVMRNLKITFATRIYLLPPFNFDGTVHVPHHFQTPDPEWSTGKYWQTMNYQDELMGIKMMGRGTTNRPRIKLIVYSRATLEAKLEERA